jgi:hypothetical protein
MTIKQYLRRWINARGPRARLIAYKLVIMAGRPFDTGILRRLAVELEEAGSTGSALHCWDLIHRLTPYDADTIVAHLPEAVATGQTAQVRWLTRRAVGLPPGHTVWLAGMLACRGHYAEAGRLLASSSASPVEARRILAQVPSIVLDLTPEDLSILALELQETHFGEHVGPTALLRLARLCFTFRKLEQAASLYRDVARVRALSTPDMVAMLYARARTEPDAVAGPGLDELARLANSATGNPDMLAMLAHVALSIGDADTAATLVERAIRGKYRNVHGIDEIADGCVAMIRVIGRLRSSPPAPIPDDAFADPEPMRSDGVPKVFVCGFGWSGSGAVYDDIRGAGGFTEFQGAGDAPLLNADSGTEATFIQAHAGLGDMWVAVKATGNLPWQRLWDMVCLHVTGMAGVGYNDYKSCAAAANNLHRHGPAYANAFRVFVEGYAALSGAPARGAFTRLCSDAAESLCRMLLEREGGKAVLFNNAVFGRNAGMLKIFRNSRAVVVFRDPLDVYVDRRAQDRNHWRSARLFVELYGRGLREYVAWRAAHEGRATIDNLREVPFERFVMDADFHRRVRKWLLAGTGGNEGSFFDPASSRRNVGMHRGVLNAGERAQLRAMSPVYSEMQRLSDRAWREGAQDVEAA